MDASLRVKKSLKERAEEAEKEVDQARQRTEDKLNTLREEHTRQTETLTHQQRQRNEEKENAFNTLNDNIQRLKNSKNNSMHQLR